MVSTRARPTGNQRATLVRRKSSLNRRRPRSPGYLPRPEVPVYANMPIEHGAQRGKRASPEIEGNAQLKEQNRSNQQPWSLAPKAPPPPPPPPLPPPGTFGMRSKVPGDLKNTDDKGNNKIVRSSTPDVTSSPNVRGRYKGQGRSTRATPSPVDVRQWLKWRVSINEQLAAYVLRPDRGNGKSSHPPPIDSFPGSMTDSTLQGIMSQATGHDTPRTALDRFSYLIYGVPRVRLPTSANPPQSRAASATPRHRRRSLRKKTQSSRSNPRASLNWGAKQRSVMRHVTGAQPEGMGHPEKRESSTEDTAHQDSMEFSDDGTGSHLTHSPTRSRPNRKSRGQRHDHNHTRQQPLYALPHEKSKWGQPTESGTTGAEYAVSYAVPGPPGVANWRSSQENEPHHHPHDSRSKFESPRANRKKSHAHISTKPHHHYQNTVLAPPRMFQRSSTRDASGDENSALAYPGRDLNGQRKAPIPGGVPTILCGLHNLRKESKHRPEAGSRVSENAGPTWGTMDS